MCQLHALSDLKAGPATDLSDRNEETIARLRSLNNPNDDMFEPTVFLKWDIFNLKRPEYINQWVLQPYICWGRTVVRNETDVVMLTHLILYFTTSVPSAVFL